MIIKISFLISTITDVSSAAVLFFEIFIKSTDYTLSLPHIIFRKRIRIRLLK
jgi:hypothetical protein